MSTSAHVLPVEPAGPLPVIAGGLLTTGLGLFALWFAQTRWGFSPMFWYADFVLPLGAIGVGCVVAIGYAIASSRTGVKISNQLLWTVLGLQVLAYFAAQYLAFRHQAAVMGTLDASFLRSFDAATRGSRYEWAHGHAPAALGAGGYAFRALELAGFAAGGLIGPLLLRWRAFCEPCQRYMIRSRHGQLAASLPGKPPQDPEALARHDAEELALVERGLALIERLTELAGKGDALRFEEALSPQTVSPWQAKDLSRRFMIETVICPGCHRGSLRVYLFNGKGQKLSAELLRTVPFDHRFGEKLLAR